jgi:hypothetical protein
MKKENPNPVVPNIQNLSISQIASLVVRDWKSVYFGAVPYLEAMQTLQNINDNYGADSGKSIVVYFLSNAQTWKGDVAREVKKELNRRIKS